MYAIIKTGGKQYRVAEGQALRVEKLAGDVGDAVTLEDVLLVGGDGQTRVGAPRVAGASVSATITRHGRAKKIIIFKKKCRKGYHKKQGHRQDFTELRITTISA